MKAHAEHLRLIENWDIPPDDSSKIEGLLTWFLPRRDLRRVVGGNQRAVILCRKSPRAAEGKSSLDEEDIPLAELAGRLKARKQRLERE